MAEEMGIVKSVKDELSTETTSSYCSISGGTVEAKKAVFNAMNNPDAQLSDFINKKIVVKDVFVESMILTDEETGETTEAPHIVFIDEKGKSYSCVSKGVFSALRNAILVFGEPTWEDGLPIVVKQKSLKGGFSMLTFDVD